MTDVSVVPPPAPVSDRDPSFWAAVLDGVDEAVLVFDGAGVVRAANAVAVRMVPGVRVGEVLTVPRSLVDAFAAKRDGFAVDVGDRRLSGRWRLVDGLTVWFLRDITEQVMRTDALLAERWRSAFLSEASRRLGSSLHVGRTVRAAVTLAVPALGDCAVVLTRGARNGVSWTRFAGMDTEPVGGRADGGDLFDVPALRAAFAGVETEGDPLLVQQLAGVSWLLPEGFGRPGAALVVPLPGYGESAGVLVVVRSGGRADFEPVETHLVRQFVGRVGSALAAAALYVEQANTVDVLQSSLVPPRLPKLTGVALGSVYRASRERLRVGGDFYDVQPLPGGRSGWQFVLGDVCGKGVEAAVQTGLVRQALQALSLVQRDPRGLLQLLNEAMLARSGARFATMVVGQACSRPEGLELHMASGGHPPPIVLRADGGVETVEMKGTLVGAFRAATFGTSVVTLAEGDTLIVHSDGITEARGGSGGRVSFGRDRLLAGLDGYGGRASATIAERIEQLTTQWLGDGEHDDIAALVIQARSGQSGRRHLRAVRS